MVFSTVNVCKLLSNDGSTRINAFHTLSSLLLSKSEQDLRNCILTFYRTCARHELSVERESNQCAHVDRSGENL